MSGLDVLNSQVASRRPMSRLLLTWLRVLRLSSCISRARGKGTIIARSQTQILEGGYQSRQIGWERFSSITSSSLQIPTTEPKRAGAEPEDSPTRRHYEHLCLYKIPHRTLPTWVDAQLHPGAPPLPISYVTYHERVDFLAFMFTIKSNSTATTIPPYLERYNPLHLGLDRAEGDEDGKS